MFAVVGCLLSAGGASALLVTSQRGRSGGPPCSVTVGRVVYPLDATQAMQATTIAVVAVGRSMPPRAVTVALATALQESGLRNLRYGDRDSLGLFQQRPSQGWGAPAQLLTPTYAADAFFTRLLSVPDWQRMSVNDAAQAVQRSAFPEAYGQWEAEGRALARAFTGSAPGTFSCRTRPYDRHAPPLGPSLASEMRSGSVGSAVSSTQGWAIASWLVARAGPRRVTTVSFADRWWSSGTGRWSTRRPASNVVTVTPRSAIG